MLNTPYPAFMKGDTPAKDRGAQKAVLSAPVASSEPFGGDRGDRTPNLGIANAALSQLSYVPTASLPREMLRASLH